MKLASDVYRDHLEKNNLQQDPRQLLVLESFDRLCLQFNASTSSVIAKATWQSILRSLGIHVKNMTSLASGIYLWGSVGIGKTFLMDCFFDSLITPKKQRIHFHHFMQDVHAQLQQYSGHSDPLSLVAKSISEKAKVLCLDEFFVADIVDAMVLSRLLKALFDEGICFVTTSNIPPDQLYKDGLQRESFLPAIAMLEQNLEVIHLMSDTDYRLHYLNNAGVYYSPLDNSAEQHMEKAFQLYANANFSTQSITIMSREIAVVKSCMDAAWFDFKILCGDMRCKQDYLALAEQFSIILLSNVPVFDQRHLDEVTRFIQLVDIFYDAKIKLVISAEALPHFLYTQGKLIFDFQRIISRLIEMQSAEYFSS
ncbi:MAG: AFG1 family ATPase [Gammaproteobacteria bacterium]|nr:AFG1 family ATPase [Gammaproteobacteria bacterium]